MKRKDVKIKITNNIPAYEFRKKYKDDPAYSERLKKISNKDLMYALYFFNRMN